MSKTKGQNLVVGASVLALAGLIAKILSAVYRVPFQNLVGNTGFYVYQQVYPIYGIGMVFALSGWPLFVSKLIAEQNGDPLKEQLVARRMFWLLALISMGLFILIYGAAPVIAILMGNDTKLTGVIQAVAWMFWLMPFLTIGRGFAQGKQDMLPTAISQVIEQVVRVTVILVAAYWAVKHGWSMYLMGAWTTFSATLAALAASVFLMSTLRQVWHDRLPADLRLAPNFNWRHLLGRLLNEGGLLAMIAALLVLLQLMDSFSVKVLLEDSGLQATMAEATKGVYDRGQPMVQLGMVVATGLGTSLLPTLRLHLLNENEQAFKIDFQMTTRLSLLFSVVTTVGLVAIMPALNQMLFGSQQGSTALAWYSLTIIPATLITVLVSTLQSFNRTKGLAWMISLTLLCKFGLNILFVPIWQINGASVATLLALVPLTIFTIWRIPSGLWHKWRPANWYFKLIGLASAVGLSARLGYILGRLWFGSSRLASVEQTALAIMFGLVVCIIMLRLTNILSIEEWSALPHGKKFYDRFIQRRKNAIR